MNYTEKRYKKFQKLLPVPVKGQGLFNALIDNLPFEAHYPSYNYLGPGTNLDLRLEKNIKPINKLDEAALAHDLAYSKSKKLKDRHVADYNLEQDAWKRVLSKDASLGEKTAAWLTTTAMKAKKAVGAGVGVKKKKTKYIKHPINLTDDDKVSVAQAVEVKKPVEITVNLLRTKDSVMSETYMPLTEYQIKRLKKAKKENKPTIKLKLSASQLLHLKQGGFLPALLAATPAVVGALSAIYNSYSNKKANDQLVKEKIRHNKAMEGKGLYMYEKPIRGGNVLLKELLKKKKFRR